jgi:hypothetical protein
MRPRCRRPSRLRAGRGEARVPARRRPREVHGRRRARPHGPGRPHRHEPRHLERELPQGVRSKIVHCGPVGHLPRQGRRRDVAAGPDRHREPPVPPARARRPPAGRGPPSSAGRGRRGGEEESIPDCGRRHRLRRRQQELRLRGTARLYQRVTGDSRYAAFGAQQRDCTLGANAWGVSLVVGVGTTFPQCPHHQAANLAGPSKVLYGAVVNGPNGADNFADLPFPRRARRNAPDRMNPSTAREVATPTT